ncbi:MAG: type 11 methyltransferase [Paenibacillaceae bacterium]|nr:type 11 methyltransferase [Paenibacillaceae bacterium]
MDYMDMLAKLGVGNAHPGGFAGSLRLITHFAFGQGTEVLEVGCGTGRTACRLAKLGCKVTAADTHPVMLAKARKRMEAEGVQVAWVQGAAESLPFADNSFDRVIVESVTVFTDAGHSLKEFLRVLRPGGLLLDRELIAARPVPEALASELRQGYRVKHLHTAGEWINLLRETGFATAELWDQRAMSPQLWEDVVMYPDPHQSADRDLSQYPSLWDIARRYDELMNLNHAFFGHAVLMGRKAPAPQSPAK